MESDEYIGVKYIVVMRIQKREERIIIIQDYLKMVHQRGLILFGIQGLDTI